MKNSKVLFIWGLLIASILLIGALLLVFRSVTEESTYTYIKKLNINIFNDLTEAERANTIKTACKEYCSTKDLKKIECTFYGCENILAKNGEIVYCFEELIDDSKEGGNVAVANIYYNTSIDNIYQVEYFKGAGKAYSIGGKNLDVEKWSLSINDIVDMFIERYTEEPLLKVQGASLKISIKNNVACCTLFSELQKGYVEKMTFDMK